MPRAKIKLNNTTMFMVIPAIWRTANEMNMDSGMARPTNHAVLAPSTNNSTPTTKMRPEMMLFSSELTMLRMSFD